MSTRKRVTLDDITDGTSLTIMMAEKLADRIKGAAPLATEEVPVFTHPQWESQQR